MKCGICQRKTIPKSAQPPADSEPRPAAQPMSGGSAPGTAPTSVAAGDRVSFDVSWSALDPATRYLGAISHRTPTGLYGLTIINVQSP